MPLILANRCFFLNARLWIAFQSCARLLMRHLLGNYNLDELGKMVIQKIFHQDVGIAFSPHMFKLFLKLLIPDVYCWILRPCREIQYLRVTGGTMLLNMLMEGTFWSFPDITSSSISQAPANLKCTFNSAFANSCPLQTDTFIFPLIRSHNILLSQSFNSVMKG